ncbi:hypothetical protein A2U01_0100981 [Trifolium medium]|uniref:Uncharacterized protein n=1 Tax=Trifolium medium TaxID=97028 RepID=A0A392UZZ7_9FABA|nr:hypothetical protein [Trifolium medium]
MTDEELQAKHHQKVLDQFGVEVSTFQVQSMDLCDWMEVQQF